MGKLNVYLCIVFMFCTMCKKQTDTASDFSLLTGREYILKTDRVSLAPEAQFPADGLVESNYTASDEDIRNLVTFPDDGKSVSILPGPVTGELKNDDKTSKYYELDSDPAAGGRFIIWMDDKDFEAELTVYGSGIPIIRSERGKLDLKRK